MMKRIYQHLKNNNLIKRGVQLEYKGYKGSIEYSEADNCLFGKVLSLNKDLILYEGHTIDELRTDFEAGIDSYLSVLSLHPEPEHRPRAELLSRP
jgi:predicted HicB family RNase H-like nuclease